MPYIQAYDCLLNPNSTLPELLEALEDVIGDYIYLATISGYESKAGQELREGVAEDLLKLLGIKLALKNRIVQTINKI
ncbi:hypothetical protein QUA41_30555 [Microcoleus sp. Pol11C1]|uniref:hypothetical protein n=1 Tax=unclassified Microcoleus TaxID=2642155 RepID=UPI002FCF24E2